jgi:hypothetical protein
MLLSQHQITNEKSIYMLISPFIKRGLGGFEIIPAPSLRGAQRRGNLSHQICHYEESVFFPPTT